MRQSSCSIRSLSVCLIAPFALWACVQPPALVVEGASGEIPLESWTASLASAGAAEPTHLTGTVTLAPGNSIRETRAMLTLAGGTPHAVYPWYVQLGECGNDRGVLASLIAYPPIAVDSSGHAMATVTLPFTLPTSGRYFVSVRRSETDVSTVIACGNLTRTGPASTQMAGYAKAP